MAERLQEFFNFFLHQVNEKDSLKERVKEWVGPYDGKILQVYTPEAGPQYIVVTKKGMELREGEYPSPDVIYKADAEILLGIFTGDIDFRQAMKDRRLEVIGNAHESDPLANLILEAMTSAM
ncbi:MAG: hypothetical protein GF309_10910 [Candidatus Lokiarchaeota archaeon]|nr:hypothetical protein [Candidatus Lokiarchaeota archaeon]